MRSTKIKPFFLNNETVQKDIQGTLTLVQLDKIQKVLRVKKKVKLGNRIKRKRHLDVELELLLFLGEFVAALLFLFDAGLHVVQDLFELLLASRQTRAHLLGLWTVDEETR